MGIFDDIRKLETLQFVEEQLKASIDKVQRNCAHVWNDPIYDPMPTTEQVYSHLEGHGSDPIARYNTVRGPDKPRWKRTCTKCGKVETTYKKKSIKTTPDFS